MFRHNFPTKNKDIYLFSNSPDCWDLCPVLQLMEHRKCHLWTWITKILYIRFQIDTYKRKFIYKTFLCIPCGACIISVKICTKAFKHTYSILRFRRIISPTIQRDFPYMVKNWRPSWNWAILRKRRLPRPV